MRKGSTLPSGVQNGAAGGPVPSGVGAPGGDAERARNWCGGMQATPHFTRSRAPRQPPSAAAVCCTSDQGLHSRSLSAHACYRQQRVRDAVLWLCPAVSSGTAAVVKSCPLPHTAWCAAPPPRHVDARAPRCHGRLEGDTLAAKLTWFPSARRQLHDVHVPRRRPGGALAGHAGLGGRHRAATGEGLGIRASSRFSTAVATAGASNR